MIQNIILIELYTTSNSNTETVIISNDIMRLMIMHVICMNQIIIHEKKWFKEYLCVREF